MGENNLLKMSKKIAFGSPSINKKEINKVLKVLNSRILVHGPLVNIFENQFKKFTGAKDAIAASSCTAGLHLLYFTLGIKKGDEVIVPSQTHLATAHAVELAGAKAVFVDCKLSSGNIDPNLIKKKINRKTKAICIVHFLGIPADMNEIKKIAKKHKLYLIEDCALAVGSYFQKKHVGLHGDAGVFSFYPVKHMTTGEGGMIILKNTKLSKKLRLCRAFGVNKNYRQRSLPGQYDCNLLGFNYRMSELHAAIGIEQLKKIKFFIKKRKINFNYLFKVLGKNPSFDLILSRNKKKIISYYCFQIVLKNKYAKYRDQIIMKLKDKKIGTSIYYPKPVPQMKYYKKKYMVKKREYINASIISNNSISLPIHPELNKKNMIFIANNLKDIVSRII